MKSVFLAGPMRGLSREQSLGWRIRAKKMLEEKFNVIHALKGREEKETFIDPRQAVSRDKFDILRSDIILVSDEFPNASGIGTSMEILFAWQNNKIVILFGSGHPNDYFLNYHIHARYPDLESACEALNKLYT